MPRQPSQLNPVSLLAVKIRPKPAMQTVSISAQMWGAYGGERPSLAYELER